MIKKAIQFLIVIVSLLSCSSGDERIEVKNQNFLIFGHFYGHCRGENWIETFKLTENHVFEDTVDDYSGNNFKFIALEDKKFQEVRNLVDFLPNQLFTQRDTIYGCPDCADGGGLFIQYSKNGVLRSWRIDQSKQNVPKYLHDFIDKVNEKISLLNK